MKFNKGQWLLQADTSVIYPITITDVLVEADALTISGYDHRVHNRNSFIHGTIISARFTSPLPNVIRVELTHFKGRQPRLPDFDRDYTLRNAGVENGRDDQRAWLTAGSLSVVVPTVGDWRYALLRDGELLTESEPQAVGLFTQGGKTYLGRDHERTGRHRPQGHDA